MLLYYLEIDFLLTCHGRPLIKEDLVQFFYSESFTHLINEIYQIIIVLFCLCSIYKKYLGI